MAETIHQKARRLIAEGHVRPYGGLIFEVEGDTGKKYLVYSQEGETYCTHPLHLADETPQQCSHAWAAVGALEGQSKRTWAWQNVAAALANLVAIVAEDMATEQDTRDRLHAACDAFDEAMQADMS